MDALTELLMQQLSGGGLSQISQRIGADESTTGSALSAAAPLLLSALAKNASESKGAISLQNALTEDHDGSILDNMSGFLGNPEAANGAGILGHILGGQQPAVTNGLAQNTGLDVGQIGQLLQIAAPLIMGLLGKQQQQQGFDTNGLAAFLGGQQQMAQQSSPDLMSMVGSLLGGGLQGTQSQSSTAGDMLGSLLGGGLQSAESQSPTSGGGGILNILGSLLGGTKSTSSRATSTRATSTKTAKKPVKRKKSRKSS